MSATDEIKTLSRKAANLFVSLCVVTVLSALGFALFVNEVQIRCAETVENRQAVRELSKLVTQPLIITPGASPDLVRQVVTRNRLYAAQRELFLKKYPEVNCDFV